MVLRLAGNKLSGVSEEFQENLTKQLQKLSKIFSKLDFGDLREERERLADIESLDEEEVQEV